MSLLMRAVTVVRTMVTLARVGRGRWIWTTHLSDLGLLCLSYRRGQCAARVAGRASGLFASPPYDS